MITLEKEELKQHGGSKGSVSTVCACVCGKKERDKEGVLKNGCSLPISCTYESLIKEQN